MDQQTPLGVLTAFTMAQRQMLLMLEALMNDNKHLTQTPYDTRHRIRQLAYFWMIHESNFICCESIRMHSRTFAILCHIHRTVAGLSSIEIVDVEEMVAMFLHVLVHDTIRRVNKKPIPIINNCTDQRWKCFENFLGALDGTYIKVNVPAADCPMFKMRKEEIATNLLGICDIKGNFVYVLAG
ncbi:retrotransposon protein [Cucumis melo var. makuwa]|uniref:Retrotransposon protein n=1 Tax=Cucumis melo var. makuwa TaxID=1194695 RepID=A0A5A7TCP8_CUCMM|nr:retrotransposon protein [Cucumis melo var. makuwa]